MCLIREIPLIAGPCVCGNVSVVTHRSWLFKPLLRQLPPESPMVDQVVYAETRVSDPHSSLFTRVAICRDVVPESITSPSAVLLMAAYAVGGNTTSPEDLAAEACAALLQARDAAAVGGLWEPHRAAWATLWDRGVQVTGNSALARLINATMYVRT